MCDALMRQGMLIRAGSTLGLPGYVRVTMAPDELVRTAGRVIVAAPADAPS